MRPCLHSQCPTSQTGSRGRSLTQAAVGLGRGWLLPRPLLQVAGLVPVEGGPPGDARSPGTAEGLRHSLQGSTCSLGSPQQRPELHQAGQCPELERGHQTMPVALPASHEPNQSKAPCQEHLPLSFCPRSPTTYPREAPGCPVTSPARQPALPVRGLGHRTRGLSPPGPGPLLPPRSCSRTPGRGPKQTPGSPGEKASEHRDTGRDGALTTCRALPCCAGCTL